MKIEELDMDLRSTNALVKGGVTDLEQLGSMSNSDLLAIPKVTPKVILSLGLACLRLAKGTMLAEAKALEESFPYVRDMRKKAIAFDRIREAIDKIGYGEE